LTAAGLDDMLKRYIEWLNESDLVKEAKIERGYAEYILEIGEC